MVDVLLRNISYLVTMDDAGHEPTGVDLSITGNQIEAIGKGLRAEVDTEIVDASNLIVTPGLVNAHQHLYQVGMRSITELERSLIHPWLNGLHIKTHYWWQQGYYTPETIGAVAAAGMLESLLGGVTTVADQHYVFPGGVTEPYIEAMIDGAVETGIRFHAGRGSMTRGRANGGVVPDQACQTVDEVVRHSLELIEKYHDPSPSSQIRIDLAPCGAHTDEPELFREFAEIATDNPGVGLHTHLYEVIDTKYCEETYGLTPWRFLGENGWHDSRVWLAHMVDPPEGEIAEFAETNVGIVHLVAPDLRMGFGLAPLRKYLDAGCKVGFGTTGSASNDGANQLGDLRIAALAHRSPEMPTSKWPTARELLKLSTRGSAECLGRETLGVIAPGMTADLAAWDMSTVDRVGIHDPVVGLILAGLSDRASLVVVNGEIVVRDSQCLVVDEKVVAEAARNAFPARPIRR